MRIVFFGTGKFAVPALERLAESGHETVAVVTQPDKKRGRGWKTVPTPVKAAALSLPGGMRVLDADDIRETVPELGATGVDVFVVVDYGRILRKEILDIPSLYCVNLHPSLLPLYRGAAPVNRAVLDGRAETGNTVIKMNERMDAGDIILQERTAIGKEEDAATLACRLAISGAELLLKALDMMEKGEPDLVPQAEEEASYAPKLRKEEGLIDWNISPPEIVAKVRGMQPWPGAYTFLNGRNLRIIQAETADNPVPSAGPGTVNAGKDLTVAASGGSVRIKVLQMEGKRPVDAEAFLRGRGIAEGVVLGAR